MAFQIKGIDLNPYAGDSWMGLTRDQAKIIATVFIIVGLFFADPPFSGIPTDFANIWLAGEMSKQIPQLSFGVSLIITYTVIAWGLILLGVWIYPYNTKSLLNGYMNKLKRAIAQVFKHPIYLLIGLTIFYLMIQWYTGQLVLADLIPSSEALITQATEQTVVFVGLLIMLMFIFGKNDYEKE